MHSYYFKTSMVIFFVTLSMLLNGCGSDGGGDTTDDTQDKSNPAFVAKAEAIALSSITLYQGHITKESKTPIELNVDNLTSGELLSIETSFEITGDIEDYSLTVQLVPQDIVNQFSQGSTLGEVTNSEAITTKPEGVVTLGSVYIDKITAGLMTSIVHAKLPTLAENKKYQAVVTPSLSFLSDNETFTAADANLVPILIDDRILSVNQLDSVSVKIINLPELTDDNEFSLLEAGGKFDENGYAIDPVFQTSIKIDITTFNKSEDVALSLSWTHPTSGTIYPVGLLSSDVNGNPIINDIARFTIKPGNINFINLPVVAYAPIKTQVELLKLATNIKDLADLNAVNGNFSLHVFYDDAGTDVSAGNAYSLSIPLVSQGNRVIANDASNVIGFTQLRAGDGNSACLFSPVDIDSSQFIIDSTPEIFASTCSLTPDDNYLWRYDVASKYYVNKATDENGNNYCITAFGVNILPSSYRLEICQFDAQNNEAIVPQRFILEDEKIKLSQFPAYLDVNFTADLNKPVKLEYDVALADNFATFSISTDGKIFHVSNFVDRTWGDEDEAAVTLSYGGESFADYLPVIGTTTQGHATLTAYLLGKSENIFDAKFAIKKHLPKKISISGNNSPDVDVENGATLDIDVIGGFSAVHLGGMSQSTITETYSSSDVTNVIFANAPDFDPIEFSTADSTIDVSFLDIRYIVVVIPIQIKGGITGDIGFNVNLNSPGLGLDVAVTDTFKLSGYLKATLDALLASVTLDATVDVLDQNITFLTQGGFTPEIIPNVNILFNFDTSMAMSLKLLRGTVSAEYEYDYWLDSGEGEHIIYQSPYLFNADWTIYDESLSAAGVNY